MQKSYFRTTKVFIFITASFIFFFLGFLIGNFEKGHTFDFSNRKIVIENKKGRDQRVGFNIFWNAWNQVTSKYFKQEDIDPQKMVYGAIKGMVASLGDPYTVFFDPDEFEEVKKSMASRYEGIGIEMGFDNNQIVVITPFEGSPASKAGIKAGDYILKVEDESTIGMSLSETAIKIRGEKGTEVKLTLLHKGEKEPYEVKITRALITYDTVKVEFIDDIAYIRILQFADGTNAQWDKAMNEIRGNHPKGVVLDLRNNPGGYVDSAVYIAGDFVGRKVIVKQRLYDGTEKAVKSVNGRKRLSGYKTVILLNEGSASASEILAGALSYYKKMTIVGTKSFGKGIIQEQIPMAFNTALRVTDAQWLTPSGENIHEKGIEPDIKIEMTVEEIKNGDDPQLDKAKELLSGSD